MQPGTPLAHIHRLRVIVKRPVMADVDRFPTSRVPGFPRNPAELPQLLLLYLLERWGTRVSAVREELRADLAGTEELRLLKLAPPVDQFVIEAPFFDQAGQPFLIATQHAQTDTHRHVNEVR